MIYKDTYFLLEADSDLAVPIVVTIRGQKNQLLLKGHGRGGPTISFVCAAQTSRIYSRGGSMYTTAVFKWSQYKKAITSSSSGKERGPWATSQKLQI